jgi:hypothetical protein
MDSVEFDRLMLEVGLAQRKSTMMSRVLRTQRTSGFAEGGN